MNYLKQSFSTFQIRTNGKVSACRSFGGFLEKKRQVSKLLFCNAMRKSSCNRTFCTKTPNGIDSTIGDELDEEREKTNPYYFSRFQDINRFWNASQVVSHLREDAEHNTTIVSIDPFVDRMSESVDTINEVKENIIVDGIEKKGEWEVINLNEKYKAKKPKKDKPLQSHGTTTSQKSNIEEQRRKVFVVYLGGTMGMRYDTDGSLKPDPGYLTQQILHMPELQSPTMPSITIIEYSQLLDSADMNASDWVRIVKDVEDNYYDFDGFVIIMGTDTMAYAASATSFMIQNLTKPIVFTGSMIPFFEVYNDARRNFITSLLIAANVDIPEVCIFFNSKLMRGNRATKVASDSLDAFTSPNYPPLASLGVGLAVEEWAIRPQPKGRFKANYSMCTEGITVLKIIPGFDEWILCCAVEQLAADRQKQKEKQIVKVLILELFGVGNCSSRSDRFFNILKKGQENGLLIVAASQCSSGKVELGDYSVAKRLKDCGVISAHDMTIEAIVTKLAYLIGKGMTPEEVKYWMEQEIRGELSMHRKFSTATLISATQSIYKKL